MSNLNWKDFDAGDWDAFGGCMSDTPRLAEVTLETGDALLIDDGAVFHLVDEDAVHEWATMEGDGARERIEAEPMPWSPEALKRIGFTLLIGDEAGVS